MTLDQKIESLLPRYKESQDQSGVPGHIVLTNGGYNKAIQQCATNLKQAFERGEIVFVEPKQFSGYSTETPKGDV